MKIVIEKDDVTDRVKSLSMTARTFADERFISELSRMLQCGGEIIIEHSDGSRIEVMYDGKEVKGKT